MFAIFCLFCVHNILPQAKEGDLSPQFHEKMFIGILFIDRPISIDMFVLVKKLSTGLIWDPICWEARALRPYRHSQLFWCEPQASIWLFRLNLRRYCVVILISKNLRTKIKEKVSGRVIYMFSVVTRARGILYYSERGALVILHKYERSFPNQRNCR